MPEDPAELERWAAEAGRLWLFLDYDGTLADFAIRPDVVEVNAEVVDLVRGLVESPRVCVAVISGRTLAILRALLPLQGLFLGGVYGLELQLPDGKVIYQANRARVRALLEQVRPQWQALIDGEAGFFLEDKGWALALHCEHAPAEARVGVLSAARRAAEPALAGGDFRLLADAMFLEIAPRLAHKGKTVQYIVSHFPQSEARLLYIGDDDKDEEAFQTVHGFGGMNVLVTSKVRPRHLFEADYTLGSPMEVRRWLRGILDFRL
jgi:trehalose-phosphatase